MTTLSVEAAFSLCDRLRAAGLEADVEQSEYSSALSVEVALGRRAAQMGGDPAVAVVSVREDLDAAGVDALVARMRADVAAQRKRHRASARAWRAHEES